MKRDEAKDCLEKGELEEDTKVAQGIRSVNLAYREPSELAKVPIYNFPSIREADLRFWKMAL